MKNEAERHTENHLLQIDSYQICPNNPTNGMGTEKKLEVWKQTEIYQNITHYLEEKQIYLDKQINLNKLSALLCTNNSYTSKVINTFFQCNLKTLLNRYRVEHAKRLLNESSCAISELPDRCGFLSRSTFYAAFLKFEGVTPTEYRQGTLRWRSLTGGRTEDTDKAKEVKVSGERI